MGIDYQNQKLCVRLIMIIMIFSVFIACDVLTGKPEKVEFFDQSFSVIKPASWSLRNDLNDAADLQMGNAFKEAYTIIISEDIADFDNISLEDHSDITRSMIKEGLKDWQETEPEILDIDCNRALRYQLAGVMDGIKVVYWHVTLETNNHYHQMLLWSLKSKFPKNQADFDSVIQSFEEI